MQPSTPRPKRRRCVWRLGSLSAPITRSLPKRSRDSKETESAMDISNYLEWPFFVPGHGELAKRVDAWATAYFANRRFAEDRDSVDQACRQLVSELGRAGFTRYSVPGAHS